MRIVTIPALAESPWGRGFCSIGGEGDKYNTLSLIRSRVLTQIRSVPISEIVLISEVMHFL